MDKSKFCEQRAVLLEQVHEEIREYRAAAKELEGVSEADQNEHCADRLRKASEDLSRAWRHYQRHLRLHACAD